MLNIKLSIDLKKQKVNLECSTNNSSDSSINRSKMNKMIYTSLGISTLIGIW